MRKAQSTRLDVLVVWRGVPTSFDSTSIRVFHLLKRSAQYAHSITLLAYDEGDPTGRRREELREYCDGIETVKMPKNAVTHTLREVFLSPQLVTRGTIPCYAYSRRMQRKVQDLMSQRRFDVIYCDRPMLPYVSCTDRPRILDLVDPVLYSRYQAYLAESRASRKLWWLASYCQHRLLEVPKYRGFDACVTVSPLHREMLEPYLPAKAFVVPYGVDLDYFRQTTSDPVAPVLIFTGAMNYVHNVKAACHFCDKILPLIRNRIPDTRLLLVGKAPSTEVEQLASGESVTVTGFVEDVRPYFANASVAIVPMVTDDGGFKTKILEAMAMGLPVVSTSLGAKGIGVTPGTNIVIADEPAEFADRVVELLNDHESRRRIGSSGRELVEQDYSWETMTARLVEVLEDVGAEREGKACR